MAKASLLVPVQNFHGKPFKRADGYFYVRNGKQFYRKREENYQKQQSPKQIWRSQAFSYAQKQMKGKLTPEEENALIADWNAAKRLSPAGKPTTTALGWKKSVLMYQWQLQHPFEPWYEAYLTNITQEAAERTAVSSVSQYQLKKQIAALSAQLDALNAQLHN